MASNTVRLSVAKCPSPAAALTNKVYVSAADGAVLDSIHNGGHSVRAVEVRSALSRKVPYVYNYEVHSAIAEGTVGLSGPQRKCAEVSMREEVAVAVFIPPPGGELSMIKLEVGFRKKSDIIAGEIDTERLAGVFRSAFAGQVFSMTQSVVVDFIGSHITLRVTDARTVAGDAGKLGQASRGIVTAATEVVFEPGQGAEASIKLSGAAASGPSLFKPGWKFEDLGIGGLDEAFGDIFRRAFSTRSFSSSLIKKLNIKHVKGILLYGPPGTGKTLMARQIGKMLNAVEPKVINGPEVFSKYVGESEKNIRELFKPAELDEAQYGDASPLHIIIFDEMDAVVRQRGSRSGDTGAGDQVVNQLLSKIDGVEALNNVLIIGMTNRKDMLDEAILRPGRLEVHIEVALADYAGRIQIFNIHTRSMRENGLLADDVDIEQLAAETKNYTGAEIEGVVKSAASFALARAMHLDADGAGSSSVPATDIDESTIIVTAADFALALLEVRPALGSSSEDYDLVISAGMIPYGRKHTRVMDAGRLLIEQVKSSSRTSIVSALVYGKAGTGTSSIALTLARESDIPFVRYISPDKYVSFSEAAKCERIVSTFLDAYKSAVAVIVIDDIERVLEYSALGGRFSNRVLQTLLAYLNKPPPEGHSLLVLATTKSLDALRALSVLSVFDGAITVDPLSDGDEVAEVLSSLDIFDAAVRSRIADEFTGAVPIKKLIMMAEMARLDVDPVEKFFDLMRSSQVEGVVRLN